MKEILLAVFGAAVFFCAAYSSPALRAEEVSNEFTKTYRAYNDAFMQGRFARAAELAAAALELAQKELGPEHEKTAVMHINLGHVLLLTGKVDEAETHLQAAKSTIVKRHGPDHPDLMTVHDDQAKIHASRNEPAKARAELERALAIALKAHGEGSAQVADLLIELGAIDAATKNLEGAGAAFQKALAIREKLYGRESPETATVLSLRGDVEFASNRPAAAEKYFTDALNLLERGLVADDPRIIGMHAKLANLFLATGSDRFEAHADRVITLSDYRDGGAQPLFIVKPKQAAQAARGSVLLEFTVTEAGRVTDARIVESSPAGVFDESTLAAARKWRFRPKVSGGVRQTQPDTRARLVFKQDEIEVHLGEYQMPDTR